jgi:hypothetical protein
MLCAGAVATSARCFMPACSPRLSTDPLLRQRCKAGLQALAELQTQYLMLSDTDNGHRR